MALDFLTEDEKALITDDFSDLVNDEEASVEITYKTFTSSGTFDPDTGQMTPTYTSKTIRAFRMPVSERSVPLGGTQGPYQLGDVRYLVKVTDVVTPTKNDRIVDGGIERFVESFSTTPVRIFHDILARQP